MNERYNFGLQKMCFIDIHNDNNLDLLYTTQRLMIEDTFLG
jgi:hypothetical protein